MNEMRIPSAYAEGYEIARHRDRARADNYLRHMGIGDPMLDTVLEELGSLPPPELHRFIRAGIEQRPGGLNNAPRALREFFETIDSLTPAWLDHEAFVPAVRVFNLNVTNMLVAFVCGTLIEGFSTLIAKSFAATGRVLSGETAKRRLMQNNRQLMEVFFPGGLTRLGDGFKLSARIRFVHGRVRYLLNHSDIWDAEAYGTPISAAHLGLAMTVFSMRLLQYSALTGAVFNKEEAASLMAVWRYSGHVMGVPDTVLYKDEEDAQRIFEIGNLCEPAPDADSARLANALIEAIPITAGVTDPKQQRTLKRLAYRISRGLIGNELADQLQYPKMNAVGALLGWRIKQRFQQLVKNKQSIKLQNFTQLLQISVYDEGGASYRLPDHAQSSKSSPW